MTNLDATLTYRWMQEVWNNGREDAIDELMDPDAVIHGLDEVKEPGTDAFKQFYRSFRNQFPEVNVEVQEVVAESDKETSRCLVRATTASGQHVEFTGMTSITLKDGKIAEAWNNFDFMTMHQQLGFRLVNDAVTS